MDIYQIIKTDHDQVKDMFTSLENVPTGQADEKENLFDHLRIQLLVHSKAEENAFYDAIARTPDTMIETSRHEHDEVENLLNDLNNMDVNDDDWRETFARLKMNLYAHIEKEETEVFARAKTLFSEEQARTMGVHMLAEKGRFEMTNPFAMIGQKMKKVAERR